MICIYCGGKTQVTNSRHQKRLNHNWRRRECYTCHAVFTTLESPELATSLLVTRQTGSVSPFSRDKLFASLLKALGHRTSAVDDASALTATITAKLLQNTSRASVSPADIVKTTLEVLKRFDTAAAVQYQAYHKDV